MKEFAKSLNQRVTLWQRNSGQDAAGQPLKGWTQFDEIWADVRRQPGLQAIKANAETTLRQASIRIRHRTDLAVGMRAVHDGITYDIVDLVPDYKSRVHVDLVCKAVP